MPPATDNGSARGSIRPPPLSPACSGRRTFPASAEKGGASGRVLWHAPPVPLPPRLIPLLEQYDFACERLLARLAGPLMDSGNGVGIGVVPLGDDEYLWEPVPGC